MIVLISLFLWVIWSIHAAKAIILAGLLSCIISATLDLFFIKKRFQEHLTPETYKIMTHQAKISDYLIVWFSDIIGTALGTFFAIPTRFAPYYIVSMILLFIYFA